MGGTSRFTRRHGLRALAAMLIVVIAGFAWTWTARDRRAAPACLPVLTAAQAARAQSGLPVDRAGTLAQIDARLRYAERPGSDADREAQEAIAAARIARGQLTGDYADFAQADRAIGRIFALAPAGVGPHLLRAGFDLTVHRLAAMPADLARVAAYRLPDPGDIATATALRGDLRFYRGEYRRALDLYTQADAGGHGSGAAIRLATYWSRMGDPDRALAALDRASCAATGTQQQLQGFIATQRGLIELSRGRWPEARAALEQAAAIFPGAWATELPLAAVNALEGRDDDALALLRGITARGPVAEAYDAEAGLLRQRGDLAGAARATAAAERLWRARLALFPEAAAGHAATHYLAAGDVPTALRLALIDHAARPYGGAATALAAALNASGRPADAVRVLERARAGGWTRAESEVVLAEAYALLGQGERADAARRRALALNRHAFDRNPALASFDQ